MSHFQNKDFRPIEMLGFKVTPDHLNDILRG